MDPEYGKASTQYSVQSGQQFFRDVHVEWHEHVLNFSPQFNSHLCPVQKKEKEVVSMESGVCQQFYFEMHKSKVCGYSPNVLQIHETRRIHITAVNLSIMTESEIVSAALLAASTLFQVFIQSAFVLNLDPFHHRHLQTSVQTSTRGHCDKDPDCIYPHMTTFEHLSLKANQTRFITCLIDFRLYVRPAVIHLT